MSPLANFRQQCGCREIAYKKSASPWPAFSRLTFRSASPPSSLLYLRLIWIVISVRPEVFSVALVIHRYYFQCSFRFLVAHRFFFITRVWFGIANPPAFIVGFDLVHVIDKIWNVMELLSFSVRSGAVCELSLHLQSSWCSMCPSFHEDGNCRKHTNQGGHTVT